MLISDVNRGRREQHDQANRNQVGNGMLNKK